MRNKRLYAWKEWTIPLAASLNHSNPFWGLSRASFCSKALYDYSSMARVRTLTQHQNRYISVLHVLYSVQIDFHQFPSISTASVMTNNIVKNE